MISMENFASHAPTLKSRINDPLLLGTAPIRGQIIRHRMINLNQCRLLIDNDKFMLIRQPVVPGTQLANRLIMLVQKGRVAVSMAVCGIMATLEAEEDVLPFVPRRLEVGRPDGEVGESRPDQVARVRKNVRSGLLRPVVRALGVAGEGRDEQIALFHIGGRGDRNVQRGRGEVWT